MNMLDLYPGRSSQDGFLAKGEDLEEIRAKDSATLERLGITHEQVSDRLEYLMGRAKHLAYEYKGKDHWKRIEKGFDVGDVNVSFVCYCGYQGCPWDCPGKHDLYTWSSADFTMKNDRGSIFASELHVHLVLFHKFFEGHTKYRLDPEQCVKVLGLKPGVSYKPKYTTKPIWWHSRGQSSSLDVDGYLKEIMADRSYNKDAVRILEHGKPVKIKGDAIVRALGDEVLVISHGVVKGLTVDSVPVDVSYGGLNIFKKSEIKYVVE